MVCVCSRSLEYDEQITDGFYDVYGDYPEVCDQPTEFPTLSTLRRVKPLDKDAREVGKGAVA